MKTSSTSRPSRRAAAAIACAVALTGSFLLTSTPAHAAAPGFTAEQESALRTQMASVGIDTATQTSLLAKVDSGIAPDSSQPDAAPVSISTQTTDAGTQTVTVFADGSRTVTTGDIFKTSTATPDRVTPNVSKSGCSYSGGWYNNCKVSISDWFSNASFVLDYQLSTSSKAKVRDVRSAQCSNTVGGCSVSAKIKRATQSSAGPAWAELSYHADVVHIGSGVSGAFGIRVSGKTASVYES